MRKPTMACFALVFTGLFGSLCWAYCARMRYEESRSYGPNPYSVSDQAAFSAAAYSQQMQSFAFLQEMRARERAARKANSIALTQARRQRLSEEAALQRAVNFESQYSRAQRLGAVERDKKANEWYASGVSQERSKNSEIASEYYALAVHLAPASDGGQKSKAALIRLGRAKAEEFELDDRGATLRERPADGAKSQLGIPNRREPLSGIEP